MMPVRAARGSGAACGAMGGQHMAHACSPDTVATTGTPNRRLVAGSYGRLRSCCSRPTGRASSWRCRAPTRSSAWPESLMGKAITQIVLTNGLGAATQLGLWFSWGQLGDQFVDDDADTHSLAAR